MPGGFLQAARNGKELQFADVNRNFEVCWALRMDGLKYKSRQINYRRAVLFDF